MGLLRAPPLGHPLVQAPADSLRHREEEPRQVAIARAQALQVLGNPSQELPEPDAFAIDPCRATGPILASS
jgi:hypothetical protein